MPVRMKRRVYDQWAQGVYGTRPSKLSEYTGTNIQLYKNNSIGPRPVYVEWGRGTFPVNIEASKDLKGLFRDSLGEYRAVYWDGELKWSGHTAGANTWSAGTTLTNQVESAYVLNGALYGSPPASAAIGGRYYPAGIGTASYYPLALGQPPRAVVQYGNRVYYFGYTAAPGVSFYSDPGSYGVLDGGTINVDDGASQDIVDMIVLDNSLVIFRSDGVVYTLTGPTPETGTLRTLGQLLQSDFAYHQFGKWQDVAYGLVGEGVTTITTSGVDDQSLAHISPDALGASVGLAVNRQPFSDTSGDIVLPVGISSAGVVSLIEKINGAWTFTTFDTGVTTWDEAVFSANSTAILVADGTSTRIYYRDRGVAANSLINGVGFSDSAFDAVGAATPELVLGEITADPGTYIRPTRIIMELDYYKQSDYVPEITVTPTVMGINSDSGGEATGAIQAFTTTTWADTTGGQDRRTFAVTVEPMPFGSAIEIAIEFDTVAFHRITVEYEETTDVGA